MYFLCLYSYFVKKCEEFSSELCKNESDIWGRSMDMRSKLMIIFFCLFICGCSNKQEPKPIVGSQVVPAVQEVEIPAAPRTLEDSISQKSGILVEKYIDKKVELGRKLNILTYLNFERNEFIPILEKELTPYFHDKQDLSTNEIYDHLVYLVGSGRYIEFYDDLTKWEHGFEMPELPSGTDQTETKTKLMNVMFLMDASGSMKSEVNGGVKMELAKDTIHTFVQELPKEASVSLLAYGHKGTGSDADKQISCDGIESVYPLLPYEGEAFRHSLNSFQASGWTPLAGAIEKAHELLKPYPDEDYQNIIYIVSDGVETCGGNPVEAAKALQADNIKAQVNIIGFDVDDEGQNQLKQVAEASKGQYATVSDKSDLETLILKKWRPTIGQLVFTNGPIGWDYLDVRHSLDDLYEPLSYAAERELSRLRASIKILKNEKMITPDQATELNELAEKMYDTKFKEFNGIFEKKRQEMDAAADEINAKVNEWKQQWKSN